MARPTSTKPEVFLAHSSCDKDFVGRLASDLSSYGIPVWYDDWNMKVGESLRRRIETGISSSGFLSVVLSPASVKSQWVRVELSAAMTKEMRRGKVFVLPVLHKPCSIPMFLRDKLYADFTTSYNDGLEALLSAILPQATLKRLIRLPAEGGVNSTADLEQKLCQIYQNTLPVHRQYFFPFLSLFTLPEEVFEYVAASKAGSEIASHKRKRHELGRQRLVSGRLSTHDVIAAPWLIDYAENGTYYRARLPKRLRRLHLESLIYTLTNTDGYRIAIVADDLPQWFLTYRVGTQRLCYISRQFPIYKVREPVGLFTHDAHTFQTYDGYFHSSLHEASTISDSRKVVGYLKNLLTKYC